MLLSALAGVLIAFLLCAPSAAAPVTAGQLTAERIFSEPSLSGTLSLSPRWSPDSRHISFFEVQHSGGREQFELQAMDVMTGQRTVLIPAGKLGEVFLAPPETRSETANQRLMPPNYEWAPGGNAILLAAAHNLVWFDLNAQTGRALVTDKRELRDPKISPNGKYVSFVYAHNVELVNIASGQRRPLTTGGTEEFPKGELDWVYREELKTDSGYWWAPDSSAIAYFEIDEQQVNNFPLIPFGSSPAEMQMQRYPLPGTAIPKIRVLVRRLDGSQPLVMETGADTNVYIPRVTWLPDSRHLAIQRLDRTQTRLDLLMADALMGKSSLLLSETDPYWVNIDGEPVFLKDGRWFLWSSERTGYRHLFLHDIAGKQIAQITKGDWEVSKLLAVDETGGIVYFSGTEKSPLERHVYCVRLDGTGMKQITSAAGTHQARFSPNAAMFLDTYSNATTPLRQDVYRSEGIKLTTLNDNRVTELAGYKLSPVEFFTIRSHDGVSLNCSMIKPPGFDPGKKYPVLIHIEGGPHTQAVVNAWMGPVYLWHQLMAQKGFIIFSLDNRGSGGRGHLFEEPIHYRFGAQELSDQRDGNHWLRMQPFVDPARIGVWGWGYGGQITLHALFEMPNIFKLGFAGAPITDWRLYDAVYSERYLGLLPLREESYRESSPIHNIERFKGKLLIAHGSRDMAVHYSQTLALIDDLIKTGKYVEVITLPGRGHEITDMPADRIMWTRVTQFIADNL